MPDKTNRRRFVLSGAAALASPALFGARRGSYATDYPDMLAASLASRINALAAKWDEERARITTPAQVEARNRFVREKFREMIHGLPERNPLNPVIVATNRREGYRVENVMFQSRPDFWVTGNLYIPDGKGPFPAVISPCGHYPWARMEPEYQFAYMNMVRAGIMVLAFDPVGQGERRQYWDPATGRTEVAAASTYEHSMPGQVLLLMGEDLTHYRVWDGMRAIDYLLTRPEVDAKRIGCAGHSGGGTLTKFIAAFDERVRCAVVNEGGTDHRWPLRLAPNSRLGPSDVEQNIFPAAVYGVDSCDLLSAVAPRPLLTLIEDYNPNFDRAVAHIRQRYEQLGAADHFATDEAADPHSWTPKLRIATTNWFSRWFLNRPGPSSEADLTAEKPETLYCTPNGSVKYSNKGQTVFTLMRAKAEKLPPNPKPAATAEIAKMLRYRKSDVPLGVRQLVTTPRKGYNVEKLEFMSEPGIYIPAWVFVPAKRQPGPVTLFFHEAGKEVEGREFGLLENLTRKGHLIVAADVRGIGETTPPHMADREGQFAHLFSAETALAYIAWYMDECLFGMRVSDVVRTVDYALSRPDAGSAGVRVVGKGAGALWALYAAALDPRITETIAERPLVSYKALASSDRYTHTAGIFVRDVLLHFDLPQVVAAIPGAVTLISPVDEMKRAAGLSAARALYSGTRARITEGTFDL